MKKFGILFFSVLLLTSCTQTKVAYVDVEKIMSEYEGAKEMEVELKGKQETVKLQLDSLAQSFQQKVMQYQQKAPRMSASKRTQEEQLLLQEQQAIQARQQQASQQLQNENFDGIEVLTKKVDSFVEVYAKQKGYNMILGTQGNGTVMYGDAKMDVTEDVLKTLNDSYQK